MFKSVKVEGIKKLILALFCLAFVCTPLSGCSAAPVVSPAAGSSATPVASTASTATEVEPPKSKPEMLEYEDLDESSGADANANIGDHFQSNYYVNPDFYRIKSSDTLTIIENFKTMQQTTDWSCGDVVALTVLNHLGIQDETEYTLAEKMSTHVDHDVPGAKPGSANNAGEYGTTVQELYQYFASRSDIKIVESSFRASYSEADLLSDSSDPDAGNLPPTFAYVTPNTSESSESTGARVADAKDSDFVKWLLSHLKANRPIMVEWGDWDGHWVSIIGYDNCGTPTVSDDILIFADSYDTSDHWQDGYTYFPLERWFSMWRDRGVAPKPYQIQPYIVVEKA